MGLDRGEKKQHLSLFFRIPNPVRQALNIQGRLKFLHGQSRQQCDGEGSRPPQLALFAIATPLQPPAILEIRTRNMIFRTKHKLDFTPMACDAKGKIVLGYTEAELRVRGSGYQFIHAADMLYCAENHVRMIKTGESGLTVFRLLTKDNRWKWVQANARLVYKNGKPDYIIATQRPLAEEEGGEHLRKRSMHLPFTFATGEALLYQTGFPLHGFPDSFQGKAKSSKSKKSKVDKRSGDELDPKSLLGALMSQDESVYVCQPDSEPKMSYHSGVFGEQQREGDGFGGWLSGDSWHVASNGEAGRSNGRTPSFDPLLSTLDSLSLDGEETCSNSELFSALENLGLNAEDLELLLLDERMIQVELDANHIPTLSDLLTNNEILSYIQDSLEGGAAGEDQGLLSRPSAQSVPQDSCLTPAVPPPPPSNRQPIVHLSQQMQQHIRSASHPGPVTTSNLYPTSNNHWAATADTHAALKPTSLNGEHKHLSAPLESGKQWQLHLPSQSFQNQLGLPTANGLNVPNGRAAFPNLSDYSVSNTPRSGSAALNGRTAQDICHYQNLVAAAQPHQLLHPQKHQQVALSCLPQRPSQSSALELEQLLGLSQPQHSLPSLEAYSMFSSTQDSVHSKLESGRLVTAANAAYVRKCAMPNGNGVMSGDAPVSCPNGLPALQDPHKSGFYL